MRDALSDRNARSRTKVVVNEHMIMKATATVISILLISTGGVSGTCQTLRQDIPVTGIGSVRLLNSVSSASSSLPTRSTLNESDPGVGWEPSTNSSSVSSDDDALASGTNSSFSSASMNSSSYASSSEVVYAIETIFTNSSGDPDSFNYSSSTNVSAVEEELIETLEVDQQVTGEDSPCCTQRGASKTN